MQYYQQWICMPTGNIYQSFIPIFQYLVGDLYNRGAFFSTESGTWFIESESCFDIVIFKNGCWWTKSSCCSYIVLILRNAEQSLSAGCFIHARPFTSSKVELIMSAWKERNEAKFIIKWNEEKFIYIFKCYMTYATFKQNITHNICVCCHRRHLFILWFNSNHKRSMIRMFQNHVFVPVK